MKLKFTKSFKKSFKKLNDSDKALFKDIAKKLQNNEILDKKYHDHQLIEKFKDYR